MSNKFKSYNFSYLIHYEHLEEFLEEIGIFKKEEDQIKKQNDLFFTLT